MDPLKSAIDRANQQRQQRERRAGELFQAANQRAEELGRKALEQIVASVAPFTSLDGPKRDYAKPKTERGVPIREITVARSGEGLSLVVHTTVRWFPGDGVNIGRGQADPVVYNLHRAGREPIEYVYDVGMPPLSGHYSISAEQVTRELTRLTEQAA